MDNYNHIEELLDRFFEGDTSNAEEKELYSFFSGNNIPEHLKPYLPAFQFFETGMKKEFETISDKTSKTKQLNRRFRQRYIWIGAAASLLLLATIGTRFFNHKESFDPYEGSYIIRNGEKITDMKIIRPELEATIATVANQQLAMDKGLTNVAQEQHDIVQIEQEIKAQYCELINSLTDEKEKSKVKKILNIDCN